MEFVEIVSLFIGVLFRLFFFLPLIQDVLPLDSSISPLLINITALSNKWIEILRGRIELVTGQTDINGIKEGLFLRRIEGSNPYNGSLVHQPPLLLALFEHTTGNELKGANLTILYIVLDIFIAFLLRKIASLYSNSKESSHDTKSSVSAQKLAFILYLFNPLAIFSCAVLSTQLFTTAAILLALTSSMRGRPFVAGVWIGVAAYLSLYPIQLIFSLSVITASFHNRSITRCLISNFIGCIIVTGALFWGSSYWLGLNIEGDISSGKWLQWEWIDQCYGYILDARDLHPNIGLFWYYFAEIFLHFRTLFLCSFQLHAFIYAIPLLVRISHRPTFCLWATLALYSSYQSYPSAADLSIQWGLLPMFSVVLEGMKTKLFFLSAVYIVLAALFSITMQTWMYSYAGNANFVYAGTLIFGLAQGYLITESIRMVLIHDYKLKHKLGEDIKQKAE